MTTAKKSEKKAEKTVEPKKVEIKRIQTDVKAGGQVAAEGGSGYRTW